MTTLCSSSSFLGVAGIEKAGLFSVIAVLDLLVILDMSLLGAEFKTI